MKLPEIWEPFTKGEWISRKEWKRDYAIQLCNLKSEPQHPVLMHDTYGYIFHFGGVQTPKILQKAKKATIHHGLQHDLLADDWYLCDQTRCDMTLKEHGG